MKQRPKPISLRPMTREMKMWRMSFMIGFVIAVGFGWYMTVGRSFGSGVKNARAQMTDVIKQTTKTVVKDGSPIAPAQEKIQQLNDRFHQGVTILKEESAKQEIYQNMATQIKSGSASN